MDCWSWPVWLWWAADVAFRCLGLAFVARLWLAPWAWWLARQALCWSRYALSTDDGRASCRKCSGANARSRQPEQPTCDCCGGVDFEGMAGRWAVVTGCTDGIGKEFALQLANQGMNVVLVSRTLEKLQTVVQEISKLYGDKVETRVVVADLTSHSGTKSLTDSYDRVRLGLDGLDVALLVNNAGLCYPSPDRLLNLPPCCSSVTPADGDTIRDVIECNVLAPVAMCRIVMPLMLDGGRADGNGGEGDGGEGDDDGEEEDGETLLLSTTPMPPPRPRKPLTRGGVVINVSSVSAQFPCPMLSVYGATKAFVSKFSKELATEYGAHKDASEKSERPTPRIDVRCLTTGFVATKMSKLRSVTAGLAWIPGPGLYAQHSLRSLACHCGCRLLRRRRGGRKNVDGKLAEETAIGWLKRAASTVFDSPSSPFTNGQSGVMTTGYITHTIMVYLTNIAILVMGEEILSKSVCKLFTVGRDRIVERQKEKKRLRAEMNEKPPTA